MIPDQRFWPTFLWGWGQMLAWAGWGALLSRWFLAGGRPDLGLAVGLGLCAMLVVGGILNAARLCSPGAVVALVVIGWVAGVAALRMGRRPSEAPAGETARRSGRSARRPAAAARAPRGSRLGLLVTVPLWLWAAVIVAASMSWFFGPINGADDLANYLMYPVKMLDTGALLEPFNIRRMSTYGGYAFLQAMLGVVANEKNAFLLDAGLGTVAVALIAAGEVRRRGGGWWGVVPIAAVCGLYVMPRGNTMCAWIGTAAALTLARAAALHLSAAEPARGRLRLAMAMAAAACVSLRANYLPLPVLFVAALLAWEGFARRAALRTLVSDALVIAGASAAMVLPWGFTLFQSSGTWLYPIFKGNHRGEFFSYAEQTPLLVRLTTTVRKLASPGLVNLLPGVVLAPLARDGAGIALAIAALLTALLTGMVYPSADLDALSRYVAPLLAAPLLYGAAALLASTDRARPWLLRGAAIAGLLVMLGSWPVRWIEVIRSQASAAVVSFGDREPPLRASIYGICAQVQEALPRGARVASLIDFPSLWDFHRQRIDCLDFPGAAVPHGPMPFFEGPEKVLEYLRSEGFDYLVYFDFDRTNGMYRRAWYQSLIGSDFHPMDQVAPRALDFLANVERLATTQPLAFDRDGMRAIRLR